MPHHEILCTEVGRGDGTMPNSIGGQYIVITPTLKGVTGRETGGDYACQSPVSAFSLENHPQLEPLVLGV